jgi:hypothetical protein
MVRCLCFAFVVVALACASGCSSTPQCVIDTDCPVGQYCTNTPGGNGGSCAARGSGQDVGTPPGMDAGADGGARDASGDARADATPSSDAGADAGPLDACGNTQVDPMNCGSCGHMCPTGTPACVMGTCRAASLYHGWTPPPTLANCSVASFDAMLPTNQGGSYPYNTGDSDLCRAWKLAATVCTTPPMPYGSGANADWTCPMAGGFTDPMFGMYCAVANQFVCTDCYGSCNAACSFHPLSLRNCMNQETAQM